jgi:DNA-directed RNA polymerase subunit RPC12/RpoP
MPIKYAFDFLECPSSEHLLIMFLMCSHDGMRDRVDQIAGMPELCANLADAMAGGYAIQIRCKACDSRRIVKPQPLYDLCRARIWGQDFIHLGTKLRCEGCGARRAILQATTDPIDGKPAIGPETEAAYREIVKRLRS